jgi:GntR family transcriptional regulator/MocR family aminotransferase
MNFPLLLSSDISVPLYKRLATALVEAIDSHRLENGSALPSTRDLARELGLSRATAVRAYEELARLGYLTSQPGGKTYVQTRIGTVQDLRRKDAETGNLHLSQFAKSLSEITILRAAAPDVQKLNFGAPPSWALPADKWKQILMRHCARLNLESIEYMPDVFGYQELRKAIANYLKRRHGVLCSSDRVVTFANSEAPLLLLSQLLIDQGDTVVLEDPGHVGARNLFSLRGARLLPIPIDEDGLIVDEIEARSAENIKVIYITPGYQDPTGVRLSIARRHHLLRIARERNITIIEDAWDSEHTFLQPHLPALQSLDQNVFFVYSFWKALYPLSMAACMVVPPPVIDVFRKAKFTTEAISPHLEQHTLADLISSGALERQLKTITKQLILRRQATIEKLISIFKRFIEIPKQSAAYHLTVRILSPLKEAEIIRYGAEHGLTMVSTREFYVQPDRHNHREFIIFFAS